jgi:hypothetical protein
VRPVPVSLLACVGPTGSRRTWPASSGRGRCGRGTARRGRRRDRPRSGCHEPLPASGRPHRPNRSHDICFKCLTASPGHASPRAGFGIRGSAVGAGSVLQNRQFRNTGHLAGRHVRFGSSWRNIITAAMPTLQVSAVVLRFSVSPHLAASLRLARAQCPASCLLAWWRLDQASAAALQASAQRAQPSLARLHASPELASGPPASPLEPNHSTLWSESLEPLS